MTPTAAQIRLAQEAGNAAYEGMATDEVAAYDAYRAAYDASMAAAIVEALEREDERNYIQAQSITAEQAAPLAEAMVEAWHEHLAGLSEAEIKRLEAMTAERSGIVDEYSSATEGHW